MNWSGIRNLSLVQAGAILALAIVLFLPNYGIKKFGPSPVVPAALLCLLGLWLVWRERLALFASEAQRRWLLVFLLLFIPVVVSIPASFNPRLSVSIAVVLLLYFFTGAMLIHALRAAETRAWLIKWIAFVLLFWVADGLIQYISGTDLFGVDLRRGERVIGPFRGNTHMTLLLAILLPLLLHYFLARRVWLAILAFGLCMVVALLGGSRAVMVFFAVAGAGLFLRLPGWRAKWLVVGASLAVAAAAWFLSPVVQERAARLELLGTMTFESVDRALSGRATIWSNAMKMTEDRPLTGVGAGAFQDAYGQYADPETDRFMRKNKRAYHAHQLYFGVVAETGLIGLAGLIAVFALCVVWMRRASAERRKQAWPFAWGLLVYAFPLNSQPVLYTQWMFPLLVLLLAGLLAALQAEPEKTTAAAG